MGVNDLAEKWKKWEPPFAIDESQACADNLWATARLAWFPISEPPKEEDTWDGEYVIAFDPETNEIGTTTLDSIWCGDIQTGYWARIRDVVLLPPTN